jgi:plastocyanin
MDRFRGGLLALAVVCLAVAPAPARAASEDVKEQGTDFTPNQVEVKVGDTVVWKYVSGPKGDGHSVKFDSGPDLSPTCQRGLLGGTTGCQGDPGISATVERTFSATGTYPYRCKIHGDEGMVGVVVVSAKATTSTSVSTTSSTLARASTTSSTAGASTSSTSTTMRDLATSSTLVRSTTTTADSTSVLLPGDAPAFPGEDGGSSAAGSSGGSDDGSDTGTVVLIVALLLGVAGGGGFLLWRLRPGQA